VWARVVVELGVVSCEQIDAVVTTIGRSEDGVDVMTTRRGDVRHDSGVLVELHEDDRAVDAVVERLVVGSPAEPGEPRVVQMGDHLLGPDHRVVVWPTRGGRRGLSSARTAVSR